MAEGSGVVGEHPALVALGEIDAALDNLADANLWSLSPQQSPQGSPPRDSR